MASGGPGRNQGRRSIAQEMRTRDLARNAIIARWGSLEAGIVALLNMDEPALTKFVFEHAIGKPIESVTIDGEVSHELTFKVIRGNKDRDSGK